MAIIDKLKCGTIIKFDSFLLSDRPAFCIDCGPYEQIVYRGLFGLRTIDKNTFLRFARIVSVHNYLNRALTSEERVLLKKAHKTLILKDVTTVDDYIDYIFRAAHIRLL